MCRRVRVLWCVAFASLFFLPALGQDEYFPAGINHFRFNFINPGARATAMGQAFIAQGNDATGSETNPAGLLFIQKPMLFAEYRHFRYYATRPYSATETELVEAKFRTTVNSPTFISYVHPLKKWAFAVYRQELANFESAFSNEDFVVPGTNNEGFVVNRQAIDMRFKLVNYGFSVARRLHETFAVGFSLRFANLKFQGDELVDLDPERPVPPYFPDLNIYTNAPDKIGSFIAADDSDWKVSFVAGFQFKPNDKISVAAVYRYGEKHRIAAVFFDDVYLPGNIPLRREYPEFEIHVPDRFGVGVSLTPTDRWTINFDVLRIFYANLNEQFLQLLTPEARSAYGWSNGNSYRLGGEYSIPVGRTGSVSFRGGYYSAPDPSIHYKGGSANSIISVIGPLLFPPLGTDHHFTFGGGAVFGNHFQLDVAGDLADQEKSLAISFMVNF